MKRTLKFAHYLGLTLFLGSIFTFLVVSTLTKGGSLTDLLFARRVISTGTFVLTLPGMWLIAISGTVLMLREYGFNEYRWLNIKNVAIILIILNSYFFIVPAMTEALELAQASVLAGTLNPDYGSAYMKESVFGAVNVLLVLASMAVGIWKSRKKES